MCNPACIEFIKKNIKENEITNKNIIEVGSKNVNGSIRQDIESFDPKNYLGVDIEKGLGVDGICDVNGLFLKYGSNHFDMVITTELLEHIRDWRKAINNLKSILNTNGIIFITTRSKNLGFHGYPFDYWRFEISDIKEIFSDFKIEILQKDPLMPGIFLKATKKDVYPLKDLSSIKLYSILKMKRSKNITNLDIYTFKLRRFFSKVLPKPIKNNIKIFINKITLKTNILINILFLSKIKIWFNSHFKNYSPDIALRYLPIVNEINKNKNKNLKIIEIGSGSLGITPYLKRKVDGVDLDFNGPQSPLLNKIKADATKIPFKDKSYDYVISMDLLEHIEKSKRPLVINEMLRLAKNKIFLGFPSGEAAIKEDLYGKDLFIKVMGYNERYLTEHMEYGLPNIDEIKSYFRKYNVKILKNINIYLHRLVINMLISKSKVNNILSGIVFVLLLPIFKYINYGNCYRYILIIDLEK